MKIKLLIFKSKNFFHLRLFVKKLSGCVCYYIITEREHPENNKNNEKEKEKSL